VVCGAMGGCVVAVQVAALISRRTLRTLRAQAIADWNAATAA
jgi:hypothetical protein